MYKVYAKPGNVYDSDMIEKFEKFNEEHFAKNGLEKFEFFKHREDGVPIYTRNFKDQKEAHTFFKTFHKELRLCWSNYLDAVEYIANS